MTLGSRRPQPQVTRNDFGAFAWHNRRVVRLRRQHRLARRSACCSTRWLPAGRPTSLPTRRLGNESVAAAGGAFGAGCLRLQRTYRRGGGGSPSLQWPPAFSRSQARWRPAAKRKPSARAGRRRERTADQRTRPGVVADGSDAAHYQPAHCSRSSRAGRLTMRPRRAARETARGCARPNRTALLVLFASAVGQLALERIASRRLRASSCKAGPCKLRRPQPASVLRQARWSARATWPPRQ